jgi:hypothetical protein
VIAALGELNRPTQALVDPGLETLDDPFDLNAGIVDVELPRDGVACPREQFGDRVAENGATPVADMQGACGIG